MRTFLVFLLMVLGLVAEAAGNVGDATQALAAANKEIIVIGSVLRVKAVAQALHAALVERGVKVVGLTGQASMCDAGSYWESLRRAGMAMRVITEVRGVEIIVDRQLAMRGEALGLMPGLGGPAGISMVEGQEAARRAAQAMAAFGRGKAMACINEAR